MTTTGPEDTSMWPLPPLPENIRAFRLRIEGVFASTDAWLERQLTERRRKGEAFRTSLTKTRIVEQILEQGSTVMAKLHELTAAYAHLDSLIDDTNMTNEQLLEYAQTIEGALQDKAINIAKLIENLESTADNIETAEKRMAQRRKAIENRVKSIKTYLLTNMVNSGVFDIDCPLFKISVRNNPYSVVVRNEAIVPEEYKRHPEPAPPTVDKKKILDDYKQGVIVDGTSVQQTKSLIIN